MVRTWSMIFSIGQSHQAMASSRAMSASEKRGRTTRAGLPPFRRNVAPEAMEQNLSMTSRSSSKGKA
jgi:hypothetical protein